MNNQVVSLEDKLWLYVDEKSVEVDKSKISATFLNFTNYFRRNDAFIALYPRCPELKKAVYNVIEKFVDFPKRKNLDEVVQQSNVHDIYLAVKWYPFNNQQIYDHTIRLFVRNFQKN